MCRAWTWASSLCPLHPMQRWVPFLASASAAGSGQPCSCSLSLAQGKLQRYLHQHLCWFLLICASPSHPRAPIPVASPFQLPVDVSCLAQSPAAPRRRLLSSSSPLQLCLVPGCWLALKSTTARRWATRVWAGVLVLCTVGEPILKMQVVVCALGSA